MSRIAKAAWLLTQTILVTEHAPKCEKQEP